MNLLGLSISYAIILRIRLFRLGRLGVLEEKLTRSFQELGWDTTMQPRCPICGSMTDGRAFCGTCGTVLEADIVSCEFCGAKMPYLSVYCENCQGGDDLEEFPQEKEEAIHHFMMFPGMTRKMASELYDEGIQNLATLVGLSLPPSHREMGIHKTIARHLVLMDIEGPERIGETVECPICRTMIDIDAEMCDICGYRMKLSDNSEEVPGTDGIYAEICNDPAFRSMPADFQEELSQVLVEEIEDLPSPNEDEEQDQAEKEMDGVDQGGDERADRDVVVICPLCEARVVPNANFCYNCGVRFEEA